PPGLSRSIGGSRPSQSDGRCPSVEHSMVQTISVSPSGVGVVRTLDDLAALDAAESLKLYRNAVTPRVPDLDGDLVGRMLAVPWGWRFMAGPLRSWARSRFFPWQGKTFRSLADDRGEGINRVFGNRFRWYRFETYVGPSRAGDFDALQLDYDNPGNPFFIRWI